jgi:flagellar basal-body rod protein FlgC
LYGSLDISVGGMIAQRTRFEAISANTANMDSYTTDANGRPEPYRRRIVQFAPGDPSARTAEGRRLGVHVSDIAIDQAPFALRYEPNSPYAYKDGPHKDYVPQSNINPVVEQLNSMEAMRAYEANASAAEATKAMMAQALRLLA